MILGKILLIGNVYDYIIYISIVMSSIFVNSIELKLMCTCSLQPPYKLFERRLMRNLCSVRW